MSSWFYTVLLALLMGGATVLMLAILVGLCMDSVNEVDQDRTAWLARLRAFGPADLTGRTRRLNS